MKNEVQKITSEQLSTKKNTLNIEAEISKMEGEIGFAELKQSRYWVNDSEWLFVFFGDIYLSDRHMIMKKNKTIWRRYKIGFNNMNQSPLNSYQSVRP